MCVYAHLPIKIDGVAGFERVVGYHWKKRDIREKTKNERQGIHGDNCVADVVTIEGELANCQEERVNNGCYQKRRGREGRKRW